MKNDAKLDETAREKVQLERTFLARHIQKFFRVLSSIPEKGGLLYLCDCDDILLVTIVVLLS